MAVKTYVTSMPDKTGAFLLASKIIARHKGNIVRASYNKAVDLHTFFLDVQAPDTAFAAITAELQAIGYLNDTIAETRVIVVVVKIPDVPGALLPVLRILNNYEINISYINSVSDGTPFQSFKMGLLMENPSVVKMLLNDIAELYQIDIVDYDDSEKTLDNTIFYIRLGNEMQQLFSLSPDTTMEFISESNRILQKLEELNEDPSKVFGYIRRFALFISRHRGAAFHADVETVALRPGVTLSNIQPPCGSNTYVISSPEGLTLIDTGYTVFQDEMLGILRRLFPGFDTLKKQALITHADVDHCGLLNGLDGVPILLNEKSADSLRRQRDGIPDSRESNELSLGYSKLSRIISGYVPPDPARFVLLDTGTPAQHSSLLHIGGFTAGGLSFEVYEGSGGHLPGEMVFVCREPGIVFTGDILVNISGFSPERAEFNSLAPYLMRSVNIDSRKANRMRTAVAGVITDIAAANGAPCLVCGGHGPVSVLADGKLKSLSGGQAPAQEGGGNMSLFPLTLPQK